MSKSQNIEKIKIGVSGLTNIIYIGRVNKSETLWLDKRDATDEALCAVRDHLVGIIEPGNNTAGYEWDWKDGKVVELRVTIKDLSECGAKMDGKENEPKEKKCGDCAKFEGCKEYTTEEETFPEVGGCKAFERKENTDADTV